MKRVIILLLSVFVCLSCTSCSVTELPDHSDNFNSDFIESFFENYSLVDPQLSYFSASSWEVEFGKSNCQYLLACIDDTDPVQFVSVTEYFFFMGAPDPELGVYQSQDAPTPMKDWTIDSITLLSGYLPFVPNDANDVPDEDYARKPMEYDLSVSEEIKAFSREDSDGFLNYVAESYENQLSAVGRNFKSVYKYEEDGFPGESFEEYTYYYLLVRFEENSNIVWLAQLYHEGTELFYSLNYSRYECRTLGSEYSGMICDLIGFEPEAEVTDTTADANTEK